MHKQVAYVTSKIARLYQALPQVEAVVLAGSQLSPFSDNNSDIDIYVYSTQEIPLSDRTRIALDQSDQAEIGNQFWEPGDEWLDPETGLHIDIMFRNSRWIEQQLQRILEHHQASVGYSTCLWFNVRESQSLFDRCGWFNRLQQYAQQPYPQALTDAIVAKNHPILSKNTSSYLHQIELALQRDDDISLQHRISALLASYFDIIFAVNHIPHPGEKRLVKYAVSLCDLLPEDMEQQVKELIQSAGCTPRQAIENADKLISGLDTLLVQQGYSL